MSCDHSATNNNNKKDQCKKMSLKPNMKEFMNQESKVLLAFYESTMTLYAVPFRAEELR